MSSASNSTNAWRKSLAATASRSKSPPSKRGTPPNAASTSSPAATPGTGSNPTEGLRKAAELLRPGGTFARFWNYHVLDEPVAEALDAVYRKHAPDADPHTRGPKNLTEPSLKDDGFAAEETKIHHWERTLSADEWIGMAATFSDHQRLAPQRLATLKEALHETIETLGGAVQDHGGTYVKLSKPPLTPSR
jgi:hypothetical protein